MREMNVEAADADEYVTVIARLAVVLLYIYTQNIQIDADVYTVVVHMKVAPLTN